MGGEVSKMSRALAAIDLLEKHPNLCEQIINDLEKDSEMSVVSYLLGRKLSGRVFNILRKYPEARDSDKALFCWYCALYCDLDRVVDFKAWLMSKDVPQFESLTRCRRKIQADFPELCGKSRKFREDAAKDVAKWSTT